MKKVQKKKKKLVIPHHRQKHLEVNIYSRLTNEKVLPIGTKNCEIIFIKFFHSIFLCTVFAIFQATTLQNQCTELLLVVYFRF
jgi:hypothetical protein